MYKDTELIEMLRLGGELRDISFAEIYNKYSSGIYAYCRKMLGEPDNANDIFQDSFLKFLSSVDSGSEIRNIKSYLFTIARNMMLNQIKFSKRFSGSDCIPEINDKSIDYENFDFSKHLQRLLSALPFEQREAFVLQVYQDKSYKEISVIMEAPLSTVRNWIVRAKKKLQENLQEYRGIDK